MHQIHFNPENASGTLSSMEYVLSHLDKLAEEEKELIEHSEKELADYKEQQGKPFEHEARLGELLMKQQDVNKQLDLDKGDIQVIVNDNELQASNNNEDTASSQINSSMDRMMQQMTESMMKASPDAGLHTTNNKGSSGASYHAAISPRR